VPATPEASPARAVAWARTIPVMAYDEALAARIREFLEGEPGVSEKKMFGGLAFLVGGNMAVSASGQGGALVRVDPAQSDRIVDTTGATLAVMQGRPMPGWLRVAAEDLRTRAQLAKWVRMGAAYAGSLPSKE
jgi:TfoX/Sxy family transcriptional regulator of competence genes